MPLSKEVLDAKPSTAAVNCGRVFERLENFDYSSTYGSGIEDIDPRVGLVKPSAERLEFLRLLRMTMFR